MIEEAKSGIPVQEKAHSSFLTSNFDNFQVGSALDFNSNIGVHFDGVPMLIHSGYDPTARRERPLVAKKTAVSPALRRVWGDQMTSTFLDRRVNAAVKFKHG